MSTLGDAEFNFGNWAKAVRNGNTFMTTGPLLLFAADGHAPGEEIKFSSGGGKLEVEAHATCFFPIHRLELVFNGRVVASREEAAGATRTDLEGCTCKCPDPAWIAARCSSRYQLRRHWTGSAKIGAHFSRLYCGSRGRSCFRLPRPLIFSISLMELERGWRISPPGRMPGDSSKILRLFGDARAELHQRMHDHGIAH